VRGLRGPPATNAPPTNSTDSSPNATSLDTSSTTTVVPTTAVPIASTTASTTDDSSTTTEPVPMTSVGPVTRPIDVPLAGGWTLADLPVWARNPCCGTPWPLDGPSPALPAPDGTLPDGVYRLQIPANGWTPYRPDVLRVQVSRFDRCGDVAEGDIWCESGLPVDPDEIGERWDQAIEFEIPLDARLTVGLTGTSCTGDGGGRDRWIGDGDSLRALWSEVDAVFEAWVRPPMWAGSNESTVMSQLEASGAPFTTNECIQDGQGDVVLHVSYTSPSGPTLLFQTLSEDDMPLPSWRLFEPVTIEARDGRLVLYVQRAMVS
jgi:hypothetical protein